MLTLTRILFFVCVCLLVVSAEDRQPTVYDFAWMTGCWENTAGKRQRDETWSKPNGGTLLGIGRAVVDGKTTEYEFMRIHQEADGIYFTAQPSGQAQASFKLITLRDNMATFENPKHDFPQRVIYALNADGSLQARIEGVMNGKQRGIDFPFKRTNCEGTKQ
ncbi:MAG: hypothetical protein JNM09_24770 [Blastocatellia bacterium]|nr:hypothetical protein [Blastocatellia bacterium]